MPTTAILDFKRNKAEIPLEVISKLQTAYCVTVKTAHGVETLNVLAFTSCDAIVRAIDILFDGEQPMPCDGMAVSASPILKAAA